MAPNGRPSAGPRCIAIVGPFQSGKTTLLEAILERTGTIQRVGPRQQRGQRRRCERRGPRPRNERRAERRDRLLPRRDHDLRRLPRLGRSSYTTCAPSLPACDAAVVVCEADERKIPALEIVLRELEEADIPRFLFINKIDTATRRVRETLELLQRASRTPLLLRQIPIWKDGIAVGFIDLALERAFVYREHAPSEVVEMPDGELPREREARFAMLERLADYDDCAHGGAHLRDRAAARPRLRRPRPRAARAPRGAGADRLGRPRQRRHAAAQGAAPRGADARRHARRLGVAGGRSAARPGDEDPAHGARRQAVGRARPARRLHGRRHGDRLARRGDAHRRPLDAASARRRRACPRRGRARRSASARLEGDRDGRLLRGRQDAAGRDRLRRAAGAGLRLLGQGQGPQGRRAPDERARQDRRGGSGARRRDQAGDRRDAAPRPGRDASARRRRAARRRASRSASRPASRRSAIARRSRCPQPRAAGTRSRPAATASSATW